MNQLDPIELQIDQEMEEFLRDLALEYPFHEIFESLRRHEFKDRFGSKISPLPQRRLAADTQKEIQSRVADFIVQLKTHFGSRYAERVDESFRFYTQTTRES
jgi:hypothetical protein